MRITSVNFSIIILFVFSLFLFTACNIKKKAASSTISTSESESIDLKKYNINLVTAKDDKFIFATIERTACNGTCPVYKLIIFTSGMAIYEGKEHVINNGKFSLKFTSKEMNQISTKANEVNYFRYKNNYNSTKVDFPSTITSIRLNNKVKSIKNQAGIIKGLSDFENYIEVMLFEKKFNRI
ncbi:MAG: DUF6438 domain-containing protein [Bacteroidota bacterium]|nr:DUF6438 domain-containing protein [Bacteroidota bacterium]